MYNFGILVDVVLLRDVKLFLPQVVKILVNLCVHLPGKKKQAAFKVDNSQFNILPALTFIPLGIICFLSHIITYYYLKTTFWNWHYLSLQLSVILSSIFSLGTTLNISEHKISDVFLIILSLYKTLVFYSLLLRTQGFLCVRCCSPEINRHFIFKACSIPEPVNSMKMSLTCHF